MESTRGHRKVREGRVCGAASDKTIAVLIERRVRHPLLGKEMRVSKKVHAHDEKNEAKVGDVVRVMETRPVSKLKRWRLVEILSK
jgi:small subunit ribosomal protein S17